MVLGRQLIVGYLTPRVWCKEQQHRSTPEVLEMPRSKDRPPGIHRGI